MNVIVNFCLFKFYLDYFQNCMDLYTQILTNLPIYAVHRYSVRPKAYLFTILISSTIYTLMNVILVLLKGSYVSFRYGMKLYYYNDFSCYRK